MHLCTISTNIGAKFLQLVDSCFPLNHELRRVVNRNTVKVSYSTMPNMAQANKRHNNKVLGGDQVENWELHGQGRRLWCRGDRAHHQL